MTLLMAENGCRVVTEVCQLY